MENISQQFFQRVRYNYCRGLSWDFGESIVIYTGKISRQRMNGNIMEDPIFLSLMLIDF